MRCQHPLPHCTTETQAVPQTFQAVSTWVRWARPPRCLPPSEKPSQQSSKRRLRAIAVHHERMVTCKRVDGWMVELHIQHVSQTRAHKLASTTSINAIRLPACMANRLISTNIFPSQIMCDNRSQWLVLAGISRPNLAAGSCTARCASAVCKNSARARRSHRKMHVAVKSVMDTHNEYVELFINSCKLNFLEAKPKPTWDVGHGGSMQQHLERRSIVLHNHGHAANHVRHQAVYELQMEAHLCTGVRTCVAASQKTYLVFKRAKQGSGHAIVEDAATRALCRYLFLHGAGDAEADEALGELQVLPVPVTDGGRCSGSLTHVPEERVGEEQASCFNAGSKRQVGEDSEVKRGGLA